VYFTGRITLFQLDPAVRLHGDEEKRACRVLV
jgi:hypothetical protein